MKLFIVDMDDCTNLKFDSFWNSFCKDYDDSPSKISPMVPQQLKAKTSSRYLHNPAYSPLLSCAED
jgi:hypothetical protein